MFTISICLFSPNEGEPPQKKDMAVLSFSPHFDPVSYQSNGRTKAFSVHFTENYVYRHKHLYELFSSLPFFKFTKINAIPFAVQETRASAIAETCQKIYDEYHSEDPDRFDLITSHVFTLLLLLKRLSSFSTTNWDSVISSGFSNGAVLVKKFISLLYEFNIPANNNSESIRTVGYYASLLNVHPNYLSAVIKKETGKTAHYMIMDHVINLSKYLLLQTDLSVKEIAYKLQFCDSAHFSSMFKQYSTFSPRGFRTIFYQSSFI